MVLSNTDLPPALGPETTIILLSRFNSKLKEIWIGKRNQKLEILDAQLKIKKTIHTERPIVHANFHANKSYFLSIGKMSPNDQKLGSLFILNKKNAFTLCELCESVHLIYCL